MLFCEGPLIRARDLPPEMVQHADVSGAVPTPVPPPPASARPAPGDAEDDDVSGVGASGPTTLTSMPAVSAGSLKEAVRAETERVERELIVRALEETNGNVTQAARILKISRKSLQTKMKEFGLRDQT